VTADDLESSLRELAIAPRIDPDHREALFAHLRRRLRVRRQRRRVALVAATFLLCSGALVRQTSLVSSGFRYTAVQSPGDDLLVMSRFADDLSPVVTDLPAAPTTDLIARQERRAGMITALHLAGRDRLVSLLGIENSAGCYLAGNYRVVVDGETTNASYPLAQDLTGVFHTLLASGRFQSVFRAAKEGLLPLLPDSMAVVDGTRVRLRRWLAHTPELGNFVFMRGTPLESVPGTP